MDSMVIPNLQDPTGLSPDEQARRKACAEQGHADAQFLLGNMYYQGTNAPQHYAEAVKWFRAAERQGDAKAQNNLGAMYYSDQGVPRDYVKAHKWFNLSVELSDINES